MWISVWDCDRVSTSLSRQLNATASCRYWTCWCSLIVPLCPSVLVLVSSISVFALMSVFLVLCVLSSVLCLLWLTESTCTSNNSTAVTVWTLHAHLCVCVNILAVIPWFLAIWDKNNCRIQINPVSANQTVVWCPMSVAVPCTKYLEVIF